MPVAFRIPGGYHLPKMKRGQLAVNVLIAINILVYWAWRTADPRLMTDNFTVSWRLAFEYGRYWTLVTSVFSHESFIHLAVNMMVLKSFGTLLAGVLGPLRFLLFYLGAGIVGSLGHAAASTWILNDPRLAAVGASGAVAGLVLLFAMMFPREKLLIFGLIPLPAPVGALAFVALDLWGLSAQAGGGGLPLGHGAHLGGACAGVLYYLVFVRPRWRGPS